MIINLAVLAISYIPAILVYRFLRGLHGDDADYRSACGQALKKGMLCTLIIVGFALPLNILWSFTGLGKQYPLLNAAFHDFILAALTEELAKDYMTRKVIRSREQLTPGIDIIAFSGIVALGFNFFESFVYALDTNVIQIIVRGLTVPHASYGFIMGIFIEKAMLTGKRSYVLCGFLITFLIHGLYDFSLAEEFIALNDNLVFIPFLIIIAELAVLLRVLKLLRQRRRKAAV